MEFEWDELKRRANIAKHGVDFVRATRIWREDSGLTISEDRRRDYGEARYRAIGFVEGTLLTVAFTWREETCRIISARKGIAK